MTPRDRLREGLGAGIARGATYCEIGRDLLAATAAAVTLVARDERPRVCVSDPVAALLDDLQFTTGEGPSVDADGTGTVVVAGDLGGPVDAGHWPAFAPAAQAAGILAVVAVPMRVGAARVGVLTLYATGAGAPDADRYVDMLLFGVLLTAEIVRAQAAAAHDTLAPALADAGAHRAEVHQASGMLSVQLGISVLDALVRLRAHAYSVGRPVDQIAAEIVARTLRLDP